MAVSGQHQWLASWTSPRANISGYFDTCTGIELDQELAEHYDGGSDQMEIWQSSRPKYTDVTVTRAYKTDRDAGILQLLVPLIAAGEEGTLTLQHVDRDRSPDGEPITVIGMLKRVKGAESSTDASTKSMFEITIKPRSIT